MHDFQLFSLKMLNKNGQIFLSNIRRTGDLSYFFLAFFSLLLDHKEQVTKRKQQTKVFMPKGRDLETERVHEVCMRASK